MRRSRSLLPARPRRKSGSFDDPALPAHPDPSRSDAVALSDREQGIVDAIGSRAVNAIEKGMLVVQAIQKLRAHWRERDNFSHPYLAATSEDDWLAENPPSFHWSTGVMAMEIPEDSPIVSALSDARDAVGRQGSLAGLDSWYDGATYAVYGDTPSVGFGTGGFETAHAIDEYVPVDDLVACAQAVAIAAMRFCEESR
jgi:acetylornithine deacetylase/succinyl-diaminopimelate desuccinylase-like protein